MSAGRVWQRALLHPVRLVPLAFLAVITLGTLVLLLPIAHPGEVRPLAAAFTAVSATCITGLAVVDTATYWTPFGQVVIVVLTQMGGFGIMSAATLLALMVRGKIALSGSLVTQTEKQAKHIGDARTVLVRIGVLMLVCEAAIAAVLTVRFLARGLDLLDALWHGVFYACMSFTNAGFAIQSDSIMGFVPDAFIVWPMYLGIFVGSLGYPVIFELLKSWRRPDSWSVHTRITFWGWLLLAAIGFVTFIVFEWTNPDTLGPMSVLTKINAAMAGTVMPRSGGFNAVDYAHIHDETIVVTIVLMFIGGGSAGTSGGLKVSTFFLLGYVILAEIRGEPQVRVAHRSIGSATQRQALSVALLCVGFVTLGTIGMVIVTDLPLVAVLFDVVSAFGTVGLSLGITPQLNAPGQILLMVLMFVGRVGTITVASALALRNKRRHFNLPEERPIVG
ncbi:Trk-type K+ transport system membrane component [Kineosphaera limosa]|uniref:Ktr system potassium uptake protein KtrB n=1 Tax=Kineosphaera limosa NBRC 100340 TaxID=1184609 RepID=K6XAP9_9MICO|nr:potassium transporter TrkG [Kineosphaera limosa]NYD99778.1 Trk-type K+ transport system membrane component [Kineosphaera limosa]GAB95879.1 Ktr system potassium uptake protein KtrB [Kineosphaera limosa NBRC 100340]